MEIRNLGRSGLRVSAIGLGCNNFGGRVDLDATRAVIHAALDLGITLFDTADIYGGAGAAETLMGQVLGEDRKRIVLATKFGMDMDDSGERQGGSRRWIMTAVEDSLCRLRTDWIDLYQFHRPDPRTPIEETLRTLDDLVRQGKVRYFGCSNMPAWQMVEAQWTARQLGLEGFVSCQDEYSLLVRGIDRDVIPAARAYGMGLLPYFPLASRAAHRQIPPQRADAGRRAPDQDPAPGRPLPDRGATGTKAEKLIAFAEARGRTMLELAFSWLLARPPVASVIAGATRPEQLEQNVNAGRLAAFRRRTRRDRPHHRSGPDPRSLRARSADRHAGAAGRVRSARRRHHFGGSIQQAAQVGQQLRGRCGCAAPPRCGGRADPAPAAPGRARRAGPASG